MLGKEILSTTEVAAYLDVPSETLRYWRSVGKGPAYFKAGRFIRYQRSELGRWVEAQQDKAAARRSSLVVKSPGS